jgi:hypothetical protein
MTEFWGSTEGGLVITLTLLGVYALMKWRRD